MQDLLASEGLIPVTDQQMQNAIANAGAIPPQLAHGYYKLTFLDPHPANSQTIGLISITSSLLNSPNLIKPALQIYTNIANSFQDPMLIVPARVNQAEDFYEQNSTGSISLASLEHSPWEAVFNLQGLAPCSIQIADPSQTIVNSYNLSPLAPNGFSGCNC